MILVVLVVFFAVLFVKMVFPQLFNLPADAVTANQNAFVRSVNALSILAIPFLLSFFHSTPQFAASRSTTNSWRVRKKASA